MAQTKITPASYAAITQIDSFPKKDQAIIIDAIDNTQLKQYTEALARVIKPTSIRFVSRIANNRICIYVSTKELADDLIDKHKFLTVNDQAVPIRPLITRNKRIILSNVCPIIPHSTIEKKLEELNITPQSPITFLRAGFTEPGFNHILSFRRQVFITPEDSDKLPESIQLTYDDTNYWIYISTESMVCFMCKKVGHVVKNCTETAGVPDRSETKLTDMTRDMPPQRLPLPPTRSHLKHPRPPSSKSDSVQQLIVENVPEENILLTDEGHLMSEDGSYHSDSSQVASVDLAKNVRKKIRTSSIISDSADWDKINDLITSSAIYPMNNIQFKSFLEKTHGVQDISDICSEYSQDPTSVIKMLTDLYPYFSNRSLKSRVTRLQRKLKLLNKND